jgi:tetratricopeptide (TPR) repeat protein
MDWQAAMDSLYGYYVDRGALARAEKVVEAMVLEHPTEQNYWERVAVINAKIGNKDKAITYFEKAFDLAPTFERARYLLVLHLQMDRPFDALPYINYGIKNARPAFNLQTLKEGVEDVIRTQELLRTDSTNLAMISHIARAYLGMDNLEGADKYVRKALAIDADNREARAISEEIHRKLSRL